MDRAKIANALLCALLGGVLSGGGPMGSMGGVAARAHAARRVRGSVAHSRGIQRFLPHPAVVQFEHRMRTRRWQKLTEYAGLPLRVEVASNDPEEYRPLPKLGVL